MAVIPALVLAALLAGQWVWQDVPGADTWNLYAATLADPTMHRDPAPPGLPPEAGYEWFDNRPGVFSCWYSTQSATCSNGVCNAEIADAPGDPIVFYVMTAEDADAPGSESVPGGVVLELCP